METPRIDYPCTWRYRLIGRSTEAIREAVAATLGDAAFELAPSSQSSGGRYVSMVLTTTVPDEAERRRIHTVLAGSDSIRMVL